jgi:hypothetical protein
MDQLASGIITLLNGVWLALTSLASPLVLAAVGMVAALVWLALIEVDELDRQGAKPVVERH